MNSWFLKSVLAVVALSVVAIAVVNVTWAIRHDDDREARYEAVTVQPGEPGGSPSVVVVDDGRWHGRPGPFFFPVVPLLAIGLVVFLVARPWAGGGRGGERFKAWHDAAHREDGPGAGA